MDPPKSVVSKKEAWVYPIEGNPSVSEVTGNLPEHEGAERDPKKNQRGIVYGGECLSSKPGEK
jgi:hypothetical protein